MVRVQGEDEYWDRGMGWRVGVSVAVVFGWLIFILLYAAFWSQAFSLFQNIVVVLVSLIGSVAVLATAWASYGMRRARAMGAPYCDPAQKT